MSETDVLRVLAEERSSRLGTVRLADIATVRRTGV